ncbi:hypothetical protein QQF64_004784 [Cirrhinus molitorella]|uniref:Uncharacterized protein n=1 Tax=Cirrhinus molitorella TaxID=172907 RepID=A0ABR3MK17_9TELE
MCAGMRFAGPSWGPLLAGSPAPRLPLKSRRPAGRADFLAPLSLFAWLLLRLIQGWITIRILKRSCRALPFQTSCCTSSLLSSSPFLCPPLSIIPCWPQLFQHLSHALLPAQPSHSRPSLSLSHLQTVFGLYLQLIGCLNNPRETHTTL